MEQNAGKACSRSEAASFCNCKPSGAFDVELATATKYGFLTQENKTVKPTELVKQILRPTNSTDKISGYRTAIMNAPGMSAIYTHYRGENLPDEQFLKNTAVDKYHIAENKFPEFYSIFIESLKIAQLLEDHKDGSRLLDISETGSVAPNEKTIKKKSKAAGITSGDTCFVIQPFAPPLGTYYEKIYIPAIEKAGLKHDRADSDIYGTGKIIDQIWRGINNAKVLVAELTSRNANVLYELGVAHTLKKPVVLVSSNEEDVPFDLQHIRVIYYDVHDPFWGTKLIDKVAENIISALENPEEAVFPIPTNGMK